MQSNKEVQNIEEGKKFKVSLDEIKSKFAENKIIKIVGAVFLLIILILFVSPLLLDSAGLKSEIEKKISEAYNANFVINGDVKLAYFPSPTVTVKNAYLLNYQPKEDNVDSKKIYNFHADFIKVKMSFFGKKIKAITFSNAMLESYYFNRQPIVTDEKFASFVAHQPFSSKAASGLFSFSGLKESDILAKNIPLIIVKNSIFSSFDKMADRKRFEKINLEMTLAQDSTRVSGDFTTVNNLCEMDLKFYFNDKSKDNKSIFTLTSPIANIALKGNFAGENRGLSLADFNGEVSAEISDLKSFYNSFLDEEGVIASKLKHNNQQIKIGAKINGSAGQIAISDLKIDSNLVKGKGNIDLDIAKKIPLIDINLRLDQLDIDNLWSGEFVSLVMPKYKQNSDSKPVERVTNEAQIIMEESGVVGIRNIDLTADIKIASAKYLEGEIKNVDLYIDVANQGQVLILPLMFNTPDGGSVWVNGVFDNDAMPPRFVGKFSVLGKNLAEILKWSKLELQNLKSDSLKEFKLHSDITMWPNSVALDSLYLSLSGDRNEFTGNIKIDGSTKPTKVAVNFNVDDLKVENYFLISSQSTYFSPGLLIKKIFWLNNLDFDSAVSLNFDRLVYKDEEFLNQKINFGVGQGRFTIDKLHLKSDKTDAQIDLNIDISNKDPKFELVASADEFHYENLDDAMKEKDSLVDKVVKAVSKNKSRNFVDQFYSLPSLEGFRGKIELDFTELKLDGFKIKNAKLFGKLKDGNLTINDSSGMVYDGTFNYKGLIGLKINKTINGNLSLENVGLKSLLTSLFKLENIDGTANISSSIVSLADKKEDFFQSFNSEIRFSVSAPTVIGYGLNDLIAKMFASKSNMDDLASPEKILFNSDATTVFQKADGVVQLKNGGSGIFKINTTTVAANGILSGNIDVKENTMDGLYSLVFLSGTRQKQVPISIASSIKGDMSDIAQNTNMNQVRQYLNLPLLQKSTLIKNDEKQDLPQ